MGEDGGHRQADADHGHDEGVRQVVGQFLRAGGVAFLAQVAEAEDHTVNRADQPEQRPEGADHRQVADELFLAGLDAADHVEGRFAGILDAVLQAGHAGGQDPAQEGAVFLRHFIGFLELALVDRIGELIDEPRRNGQAHAQVHG